MKFQLTINVPVNIENGQVPVQLEVDGPISFMHESELDMRVGGHDDPNETAGFIEFRLKGSDPNSRAVHRSPSVVLKRVPEMTGIAAELPQG